MLTITLALGFYMFLAEALNLELEKTEDMLGWGDLFFEFHLRSQNPYV